MSRQVTRYRHAFTSLLYFDNLSDDTTKATNCVRAQRRLRSAWASAQSDQSSLCAQWVAKGLRFLHADSEDSDQTGRMPRLISLRWAHSHFVVLSWGGSFHDETGNIIVKWSKAVLKPAGMHMIQGDHVLLNSFPSWSKKKYNKRLSHCQNIRSKTKMHKLMVFDRFW